MTKPTTTVASTAHTDGTGRDRGSALPLVLVMMVIGSMFVLPVMNYAMSVTKANSVLSDKTQRLEAVKSGLRVALADPVSLYERCGQGGPTAPVSLASANVGGVGVSTACYYIDHQAAQSANELRLGLTTTQVGKTPPPELRGNSWAPVDPTSTSEWLIAATTTSQTDRIWLPDLPVHALNRRSPDGYQMPEGYPECTIYFPGTYSDPIELDGPTYFTSGIYYFEDEVTVSGGANVVVGAGAQAGCATDQEAAFYAENAPSTHNINGLGGTFVLGDAGRLVVDNNAGAVSFQFNTRYVSPEDTGAAPSADVSIISVNGELDVDDVTGIDLFAEDIIEVPLSVVGSENPVPATEQDYIPSIHTPKPDVPDAVETIDADAFDGAAVVSWTAPFDGGSPITGYVVTASSGGGCATNGATECAVTGLSNGDYVDFTVVATNEVGDSESSEPSSSVRPRSSSPDLEEPGQPDAPTAVPYEGVARITWSAPTDDGGAPITSYTVTSSPDDLTCEVQVDTSTPPDLTCDIDGLDPLAIPGYEFRVVATNAMGDSTESDPSSLILPILGLGDPPPHDDPAEPAEFVPTAIVDIDLQAGFATTVSIPGYVSIPQGRLNVDNPNALDVRMAGGVLAARMDVNDARASGDQSVDIGFLETIVQRKFTIVSSSNSGPERSTAVVQVNQNGAYAVNSWEVQ